MPLETEQARGLHLALLILSLAPWLYLALVAAGTLPELGCPYLALSGRPCPLCGTARAVLALLSGEIRASLDLNPLGLGLSALAVTQPPFRLVRTLRPRWRWREELAIDGFGLAWLAAALLAAPILTALR